MFSILCSSEVLKKYFEGKINVIIDTPESWLNDSRWTWIWHRDVFREAFSWIGEIRSFLDESVPVWALSATVNKDYSHLIATTCCFSKKLNVIHTCSDRKNIRLSIVRLKEKNVDCLKWMFDLIKRYGFNCLWLKVLIYCQN